MISVIEIDSTTVIDLRDEIAGTKDLVVCLCLACSSPILPRDERAARGQLAMVLRERLEALADTLDQMTAASRAVTSGGDRS